MIRVQMLADIRAYEPKVVGSLTQRQVVSTFIALPVFLFWARILPLDLFDKIFIAVILAAPIALCGWITVDHLHLEQYAIRMLYRKILTPGIRKYKTQNTLHEELRKIQKEEEKQREKEYLKTLSPREVKRYNKAKKKGNVVVDYEQEKIYV